MAFQKPTVTIELSEYEALKDYRNRFTQTRVNDYQIAIGILLKSAYRSGQTYQLVQRELKDKGLLIVVSEDFLASENNLIVDIKRL